MTDTAANTDAGTYTLVVKDTASSGMLTAAAPITFNVTPDTTDKYNLSESLSSNYVAAANPTTTVSVQVQDKYGNNVAQAGVPVVLTATTASTAKGGFNGGSLVATPASITVTTNTSGVATATFTTQAYNGIAWSITASSTDTSTHATGYASSTASTVNVVYQPVASLSLALSDQTTSSTSQVTADHQLDAVISELDQYGNTINTNNENDTVKVTLSNPNAINWPTLPLGTSFDSTAGTIQGTVTDVNAYLAQATLKAYQAGNVTFTVQDLSNSAAAGSAAITVIPGLFQGGFGLFDSNGKLISPTNEISATANVPVAVYLRPVDAEGNVVTANNAENVTLNGAGGQFSTVSGGAASNVISFPNGGNSLTLYYVNGTTSTYAPSFTSSVVAAANVALVSSTGGVLTYKVTDANGVAITGATVNFTVAMTGTDSDADTDVVGTLSATSGTTNASGEVTVTYTAPAAETTADATNDMTDTVTATVNGTSVSNSSYTSQH